MSWSVHSGKGGQIRAVMPGCWMEDERGLPAYSASQTILKFLHLKDPVFAYLFVMYLPDISGVPKMIIERAAGKDQYT